MSIHMFFKRIGSPNEPIATCHVYLLRLHKQTIHQTETLASQSQQVYHVEDMQHFDESIECMNCMCLFGLEYCQMRVGVPIHVHQKWPHMRRPLHTCCVHYSDGNRLCNHIHEQSFTSLKFVHLDFTVCIDCLTVLVHHEKTHIMQ